MSGSPDCAIAYIAAVGIIFNVFSYDAVLSRDSNQSPPRRRADALRAKNNFFASELSELLQIFLTNIFNYRLPQYLLLYLVLAGVLIVYV